MSDIISLTDALPAVAADFVPVISSAVPVWVAVLDGRSDPTIEAMIPDVSEWMEPGTSSQVLLLFGDNVTSMDASWSDRAALSVECASVLQTFVMDERNAPWPIPAGGTSVAEPVLLGGAPRWVWSGGAVSIGDLASVLR